MFDVAAVHPYSLKVENVVQIIELFRRVMAKHGDAKLPLDVTEFGWPSSFSTTGRIYGFEMTERGTAKRATESLARLAAERRRLRIRRVLWETWISNDRVKDYPFDWSGLRKMTAAGPRASLRSPPSRQPRGGWKVARSWSARTAAHSAEQPGPGL